MYTEYYYVVAKADGNHKVLMQDGTYGEDFLSSMRFSNTTAAKTYLRTHPAPGLTDIIGMTMKR